MTPEGKLKLEVKAYLKSIGAYWRMHVPSGYGKQGLDFECCIKGRYVAIETKAPGKLPTPRQDATMREINAAGGIAFYADNIERVKRYIEDHVLGGLYKPDS